MSKLVHLLYIHLDKQTLNVSIMVKVMFDIINITKLHHIICIDINFEPLNWKTYEMYKCSNSQLIDRL